MKPMLFARMKAAAVALSLLGFLGLGSRVLLAEPKDELLPPVKINAGGKPIDADMGHAAPFLVDFDGDGINDLLVGQFGDGRLAIHKNIGTNKEPKFNRKEWFLAGSSFGRVPSS